MTAISESVVSAGTITTIESPGATHGGNVSASSSTHRAIPISSTPPSYVPKGAAMNPQEPPELVIEAYGTVTPPPEPTEPPAEPAEKD